MIKRRNLWRVLLVLVAMYTILTGCEKKEENKETKKTVDQTERASQMTLINTENGIPEDDKYRTFYEVFVYSFCDSDGDRIGDLQGLTDKLNYLNDGNPETKSDLGVNGIWLMPIMPSETYHKYDVSDYMSVDSQYGTMEDFDQFMEECQKRDIHVILDLVMNHTSSSHPWFTSACTYLQNLGVGTPDETECPYFAYYNFSKEKKTEYYYEVPGTEWYYEAKFWSEMPDLNLNNQAVRDEFTNICQFWIDHGVSGFRLDAAKEFESDQTEKNVEILSWFEDMVKGIDSEAYVVAEVWTDQNTYARYYESGIDSVFDFSFANTDGIIASVLKKMGGYTASSYGKKVEAEEQLYSQYNPEYINAPFYTNHDMGRSAGYYAGDFSEAQTKMAGALNLTMSGNCFLYYGEELGMKGSGEDENKRLGMLWEADKNAPGMCQGPPAAGSVKMKYGSLEEQQKDAGSIYEFYRNVIQLRNSIPAIARGKADYIEVLSDDNVCVIRKEYQGEEVLLLYNISETEQQVNATDWEDGSFSQWKLSGVLTTDEQKIVYEEKNILLPGYSVAVLTK